MRDSCGVAVTPQSSRLNRAWSVAVAGLVAAAVGTAFSRSNAAERAWEAKYRPEAEAYCRENPEMKYRKYLNADGSDPAPDMDAFEYCVAAHMSHMPPPGRD